MAPVKMIPLAKRSKKEQRRFHASRRGDWNGVVPVTKVIPDKRKRKLQREKARQGREEMP